MEIKSMEGCRVEIRSTEGCRYTGPHKHRETPRKYDLRKAVDLQKALDIQKTVKNTELVLKLCSDSLTGFMEAVKG